MLLNQYQNFTILNLPRLQSGDENKDKIFNNTMEKLQHSTLILKNIRKLWEAFKFSEHSDQTTFYNRVQRDINYRFCMVGFRVKHDEPKGKNFESIMLFKAKYILRFVIKRKTSLASIRQASYLSTFDVA